MDTRMNYLAEDANGEECDTLFYQGNGSSQTQALKYIGSQKITATTGEMMWCTGRNNLLPLNVIYKLHIGEEIADVNLQPFPTYPSMFNPVNVVGSIVTWASNRLNGFQFESQEGSPQSVVFHAPFPHLVSIGQETDVESHKRKYMHWLNKANRCTSLILWGVSRGTAATFCAFAKEKYPEVKLVVLEGAIDSVANILPKRAKNIFKYEYVSGKAANLVNYALSFFTQYRPEGISPLDCVQDFPENVPVVFITSKVDLIVPFSNTENIAQALNARGKNDVYLLVLERSSHPNYMFDDRKDRDCYEAFIHAIYKKYHLKHDPVLAQRGEVSLDACLLPKPNLHNAWHHSSI